MKKQIGKTNGCRVLGTFLLGISMAGLCATSVRAEESPESVIEQYVQLMDSQRWDEFADLHCSDENESLQSFFSNPANAEEHTGVLNVEGAALVDLVEIDLKDAQDMLYKDYDVDTSKVFVFGVDYDVFEDSKYYSSGVNYNYITCVKEDGNWKISEMLPIEDPQKLVDCGYEFGDDFSTAIDVMDARKKGYYLNYNGEVFGDISGDNTPVPYAALTKYSVPTSSTTVRYKNASGTIEKLKFHDYCLGVLAGELRSSLYDGPVRQAQAIAIKTFTWHYIIIPHGATEGYDLNSSQQSYKPDYVSENKKVTEDYNTVKNVWMESNGGAIFTAYYKLGTYGDQSKYKNGGEFKQAGARWLYDNNVATTYKSLLKYYYDSSSASTGGAIRFFDNDKNEI